MKHPDLLRRPVNPVVAAHRESREAVQQRQRKLLAPSRDQRVGAKREPVGIGARGRALSGDPIQHRHQSGLARGLRCRGRERPGYVRRRQGIIRGGLVLSFSPPRRARPAARRGATSVEPVARPLDQAFVYRDQPRHVRQTHEPVGGQDGVDGAGSVHGEPTAGVLEGDDALVSDSDVTACLALQLGAHRFGAREEVEGKHARIGRGGHLLEAPVGHAEDSVEPLRELAQRTTINLHIQVISTVDRVRWQLELRGRGPLQTSIDDARHGQPFRRYLELAFDRIAAGGRGRLQTHGALAGLVRANHEPQAARLARSDDHRRARLADGGDAVALQLDRDLLGALRVAVDRDGHRDLVALREYRRERGLDEEVLHHHEGRGRVAELAVAPDGAQPETPGRDGVGEGDPDGGVSGRVGDHLRKPQEGLREVVADDRLGGRARGGELHGCGGTQAGCGSGRPGPAVGIAHRALFALGPCARAAFSVVGAILRHLLGLVATVGVVRPIGSDPAPDVAEQDRHQQDEGDGQADEGRSTRHQPRALACRKWLQQALPDHGQESEGELRRDRQQDRQQQSGLGESQQPRQARPFVDEHERCREVTQEARDRQHHQHPAQRRGCSAREHASHAKHCTKQHHRAEGTEDEPRALEGGLGSAVSTVEQLGRGQHEHAERGRCEHGQQPIRHQPARLELQTLRVHVARGVGCDEQQRPAKAGYAIEAEDREGGQGEADQQQDCPRGELLLCLAHDLPRSLGHDSGVRGLESSFFWYRRQRSEDQPAHLGRRGPIVGLCGFVGGRHPKLPARTVRIAVVTRAATSDAEIGVGGEEDLLEIGTHRGEREDGLICHAYAQLGLNRPTAGLGDRHIDGPCLARRVQRLVRRDLESQIATVGPREHHALAAPDCGQARPSTGQGKREGVNPQQARDAIGKRQRGFARGIGPHDARPGGDRLRTLGCANRNVFARQRAEHGHAGFLSSGVSETIGAHHEPILRHERELAFGTVLRIADQLDRILLLRGSDSEHGDSALVGLDRRSVSCAHRDAGLLIGGGDNVNGLLGSGCEGTALGECFELDLADSQSADGP